MNHPKISIITPSFNQADYIEQTICSVLDQEYHNLEYIIIDGGSTDKSAEIIKKYSKYLSYWISEPDKGQSDAINKGYNKATGDVINWLNSDDYYEPGSLDKIGAVFSDTTVNIYCGISRIFGNGIEYQSKGTDIYPGNLEKTIGWARIDQPETFMRKKVWDKLGSVDTRLHYLMDRELWIRYLLHFGFDGIVKSDELIANFRLHPGSKTVSQSDQFVRESLNLFYSLAKKNDLTEEAGFLKQNFSTETIDLNYGEAFFGMKMILHYFFFQQMSEAYAQNNKNKFQLFSEIIDSSILSKKDRYIYNQLIIRSKFIPLGLKKIWNKL